MILGYRPVKKGRNTMKKNINETMSKYTAGEITLEEDNEELKKAEFGGTADA